MLEKTDRAAITILYDPQCPACAAYCASVHAALPAVELASARENGPLLEQATALGLDLDQGFVVFQQQAVFSGAAAIHQLSTALPARHPIQRWLFGRLWRAHIIYPLLATGRRVLLFFIGVHRINNLAHPSDKTRGGRQPPSN